MMRAPIQLLSFSLYAITTRQDRERRERERICEHVHGCAYLHDRYARLTSSDRARRSCRSTAQEQRCCLPLPLRRSRLPRSACIAASDRGTRAGPSSSSERRRVCHGYTGICGEHGRFHSAHVLSLGFRIYCIPMPDVYQRSTVCTVGPAAQASHGYRDGLRLHR